MKKLKNNKGFTLIELLAVIVILAILVAVAIPAVTRYLNTARKGTYASNAQAAISVVRNEVISDGITAQTTYDLEDINEMLEKKLENSPYGGTYKDESYVAVTFDTNGEATYHICLLDDKGNGFYDATTNAITEVNVTDENVVNNSDGACAVASFGTTQQQPAA